MTILRKINKPALAFFLISITGFFLLRKSFDITLLIEGDLKTYRLLIAFCFFAALAFILAFAELIKSKKITSILTTAYFVFSLSLLALILSGYFDESYFYLKNNFFTYQ